MDTDYFTNKWNRYVCKSCEYREGGGGILGDTGYKICLNCYERFKYNCYDVDEYCNDCYCIMQIFMPKYLFNIYRYVWIYYCPIKDRELFKEYEFLGNNGKLICYDQQPDQVKNEFVNNNKMATLEEKRLLKQLEKFDKKYNKLLEYNAKTIEWSRVNIKVDDFKKIINNILDNNMKSLNDKIKEDGKNMDIMRNVYNSIYTSLCESWEFLKPDDEEDIKYWRILYNEGPKIFNCYACYQDEDFKNFVKA